VRPGATPEEAPARDTPAPGPIGPGIEYSIVIPVYNSAESVTELVRRLDAVFQRQIRRPYEIILVDDASPNPRTWETLTRLCDENPRVRAIQLMKNAGRHAAVMCGASHAAGPFVISMDDDLQHQPEDLPRLIERQEQDVVFAAFTGRQHTMAVRLTSRLNEWINRRLYRLPANVRPDSLMLVRREVVQAAFRTAPPHPNVGEFLLSVTSRVTSVAVPHRPRQFGHSEYSWTARWSLLQFKLVRHTTGLMRLAAATGGTASLAGLAWGASLVARAALGSTAPRGVEGLYVLLLLLGGLALSLLGICGEVLLQLLALAEGRGRYVVRQYAGRAHPDAAGAPASREPVPAAGSRLP